MKWRTDATRPGFTPPNPLAAGHHCPECDTRLDKADRPCPVCPSREEQQAEYFAAARRKA